MKKEYLSPKFELEKFTKEDEILTASTGMGGGMETPGGEF